MVQESDSVVCSTAGSAVPSSSVYKSSSNLGEQQPMRMLAAAFLVNLTPINDCVPILDGPDESAMPASGLLCCGKEPRGSVRRGRMAVQFRSAGCLASLQVAASLLISDLPSCMIRH